MENIELRAKNQLLNLQEDWNLSEYESFLAHPPAMREKPKSRTSARLPTSLSSQRQQPNFQKQKQNNKQFLKDKLRKLLEKDFQISDLQLKRIKTIGSLQTVKNSDKIDHLLKICKNEDDQKLRTLETASLASFRRSNKNVSKKQLSPQEIKESQSSEISIFEKENQQIRKFIKRKMEEKALEKQRKLILTAVTSIRKDCPHKIIVFDSMKNKTLQIFDHTIRKIKIQNQEELFKAPHKQKENMLLRKANNKQNYQGQTKLSTPFIKINKQNEYEGRKLRNLLF